MCMCISVHVNIRALRLQDRGSRGGGWTPLSSDRFSVSLLSVTLQLLVPQATVLTDT